MTGYVGLPFVDGGRDRSGVDCWGLVRLYLAEELGVDVPSYSETPAADLAGATAAFDEAIASPSWQRIEQRAARRGDVVLMTGVEKVDGRLVRTRRHVGVLVNWSEMLHVEEGIDSVLVPMSHISVRNRIHSIWRFVG